MHIILALLFLSLTGPPECSTLLMKGNSKRDVNSIINIAQITLIHIKKLRAKLPEAPHIEVATPSIDGLTGISRDLGLLDNDLQSPVLELLIQIQTDVSSLEGRVRSFASTMNCTIQARPGLETNPASLYPDSYVYLMLAKVERYLEKLVLNKDKLKVC
uniref:Leptin-B-like n=2 Tax=Acanthochromis polyacanthus TaxID=80966 RepID=A0A3Q1FFR9_9TELE